MTNKNKKQLKKIANSFLEDLELDLGNAKFKKDFYGELLRLQIADEIIKLRRKHKISQAQLAKRINTTQTVISRIENTQVAASTNILERICSKFQLQPKFSFS